MINIGTLYEIQDTAQWNRILETFKIMILSDDLYLIANDYIEKIFVIFQNYFGNESQKFLDLVFDLINNINNPELHNDLPPSDTITSTAVQSELDTYTESQGTNQERMRTVNISF